MNLKRLLLIVCTATALSACNTERECSESERRCGSEGRSVFDCVDGEWTEIPCEGNTQCVQNDANEVQCAIATDDTSQKCTPNTSSCTADGLVQRCNDDGVYVYEICNDGEVCENGSCHNEMTKDLPKRQCSADKKSVEWIDEQGQVSATQTCLEDVGFESTCEEFNAGLAGCVVPDQCNDDFSVRGTCVGNRRLWCDETFEEPKPSVEDCSVYQQTCVSDSGAGRCVDLCETTSDFACAEEEGIYVASRCKAHGNLNYIQKDTNICESDSTAVSCDASTVVRTSCDDGEKCYASLGVCAVSCTENEAGTFRCDDAGKLSRCEKIQDDYAFVSKGTRECDGDVYYTCRQDETTGQYGLSSTDCNHYEKDGEILRGVCLSDYQGVTDNTFCAYAGEPSTGCGDMPDGGLCNGSILQYCHTLYNLVVEKDCAENTDGNTSCSVYREYADCRSACTTQGRAACTYDSDYESYLISVCVADDEATKLQTVVGDAVCVGDSLYECDKTGQVKTVNCAINGGRCDVNACVYPACSVLETPVCLADDALYACQVGSDGTVYGAAMSTISCMSDGSCYTCQKGTLTKP